MKRDKIGCAQDYLILTALTCMCAWVGECIYMINFATNIHMSAAVSVLLLKHFSARKVFTTNAKELVSLNFAAETKKVKRLAGRYITQLCSRLFEAQLVIIRWHHNRRIRIADIKVRMTFNIVLEYAKIWYFSTTVLYSKSAEFSSWGYESVPECFREPCAFLRFVSITFVFIFVSNIVHTLVWKEHRKSLCDLGKTFRFWCL